jgi:hypothetical protein
VKRALDIAMRAIFGGALVLAPMYAALVLLEGSGNPLDWSLLSRALAAIWSFVWLLFVAIALLASSNAEGDAS